MELYCPLCQTRMELREKSRYPWWSYKPKWIEHWVCPTADCLLLSIEKVAED